MSVEHIGLCISTSVPQSCHMLKFVSCTFSFASAERGVGIWFHKPSFQQTIEQRDDQTWALVDSSSPISKPLGFKSYDASSLLVPETRRQQSVQNCCNSFWVKCCNQWVLPPPKESSFFVCFVCAQNEQNVLQKSRCQIRLMFASFFEVPLSWWAEHPDSAKYWHYPLI